MPATETEATQTEAPAATETENVVDLAVQIEGVGEHTPPPAEEEEGATPAASTDDVLREALVSFQAASGALYHFGQVLGQLIVALQPHVPALVEPEHPTPPSDA